MYTTSKRFANTPILLIASMLALCPVALGKAGGGQADSSGVRKEIEAVFAQRDKAIKNKDFEFLKSQETADYTEKEKDGPVRTREEADALADQLAPRVKEVAEQATKVESVKKGDKEGEYIVESSDHGRLTLIGPDGNPHEVVGSSRQREVWVKTKQGWKIRSHEELESKVSVDGQPVS